MYLIKLAICDDNKEELNIAKSVIDKYTLKKELIVSAFTNPNDLLSSEEVFWYLYSWCNYASFFRYSSSRANKQDK